MCKGTWLHVLRAQGTGHGTQEDQLCILCSFILTKNQGANRIKSWNGHLIWNIHGFCYYMLLVPLSCRQNLIFEFLENKGSSEFQTTTFPRGFDLQSHWGGHVESPWWQIPGASWHSWLWSWWFALICITLMKRCLLQEHVSECWHETGESVIFISFSSHGDVLSVSWNGRRIRCCKLFLDRLRSVPPRSQREPRSKLVGFRVSQ